MDRPSHDSTLAALFALCLICLILVYLYLVKNGKKSWRSWVNLVGELQTRGGEPSKSEKREANIKRMRDKKRSESVQRRIGHC